ncbi:MAG TPA: L-rhamnose/proton symporter RhaT [Alloacidobacterium sp.]|nr:L-rhamnose/proton symporter RhaT [Alloacidobacterium sp.]
MNHSASGLALLVLAGGMNASFTLPMKFMRNWAWENTWLLWTIFALIVLPAAVAFSTIPEITTVYRMSPAGELFRVVAFGAGWGVSQIFFGVAAEQIGIALTFSLVLGTSAAVGAAIPMLHLNSDRLRTHAGSMLLLGIMAVLLGVLICAVAGMMRERAEARVREERRSRTAPGLILAILCGCGAALLNIGFAFGTTLSSLAAYYGASRVNASSAIWLPLLSAGAIPNLLYCLYLFRKNSSGRNFKGSGGGNWFLALVMGALWFGSVLLYGVAVFQIGLLGTSVGWSVFMSMIVIVASFLGILTGEWRRSGSLPLTTQLLGVGTLVISIFILGADLQR